MNTNPNLWTGTRYMGPVSRPMMLDGYRAARDAMVVRLLWGIGPDWIDLVDPTTVRRVTYGTRLVDEQVMEQRHWDAVLEEAEVLLYLNLTDEKSVERAREEIVASWVATNEKIEWEDRLDREQDTENYFYLA